MSGVGRGGRYPAELRERAVRMVFEHTHEYPSQWKAIESIAEKLDINRETLRVWVRRAEVDEGRRPGVTADERARLAELEREVKELRRGTARGDRLLLVTGEHAHSRYLAEDAYQLAVEPKALHIVPNAGHDDPTTSWT